MKYRLLLKECINVFKPLPFNEPVAVVFLFHNIEKDPSSWTAGHRYITPFAAFKRQIEFIQKHFTIISTTELIQALKNGLQDTEKIASIHFDDGFCSYSEIALPYLSHKKITSAVFLIHDVLMGEIPIRNKLAYCLNTSSRIKLLNELQPFVHEVSDRNDNICEMSTAQILAWSKNNFNSDMEKSVNEIFKDSWDSGVERSPFMDMEAVLKLKDDPYVEIGSHTFTHSMLSNLSEDQQRNEIISGHRALEKLLGIQTDIFAYPYGGLAHFDEISCSIVQEREGMVAFSTYGGVNRECDRVDVKRITLSDQSSIRIKSLLIDNL